MKKLLRTLFVLLFFILPSLNSYSQTTIATKESDSAQTPHVEVLLLSEYSSLEPGKINNFLIQMKMIEGWHTYWKNPGDSGLPVQMDWKLPKGFSVETIEWPSPERINIGGVMNFGYHQEALLFVKMMVPNTDRTKVKIQVAISWLVCEKICIPENGTLTLELPIRHTGEKKINSTSQVLFAKSRASMPITLNNNAVTVHQYDSSITLEIEPSAAEFFSQIQNNRISAIDFFPEQEGIINYNKLPEFEVKKDGKLLVQLFKNENANLAITSLSESKSFSGVLTLLLENSTSEKYKKYSFLIEKPLPEVEAGAPSIITSSSSQSTANENIFLLLLFAFLGGLILNLMPCVFPILALKVMHVVEYSHAQNKTRIYHSISYSAGVVFSFLFLAALLLILRFSGEQIGWGFQLQSPVFIFSLAVLLYLMALNLLGFYEISSRFSGIGDSLTRGSSMLSSFCTGALAVIAATPCTAPFMGTAIGVALGQSIMHSFFVFLFLGIGMSFPYLLLAFSPKALRFLPKPGAWMQTLKEALSFPLLVTVIWLLWILNQQSGSLAISSALLTILILTFALWLQKKIKDKNIAKFIFAGLCIASAYLAWGVREVSQQAIILPWEKFSEHLVDEHKKNNRYIFIDYTADWCITCKVNEKVTIQSQKVISAFKEKNVALLRADWTSYDPEITQSLKKYNRAGVPLYLLFVPGKDSPEILPQILQPQDILQYLK